MKIQIRYLCQSIDKMRSIAHDVAVEHAKIVTSIAKQDRQAMKSELGEQQSNNRKELIDSLKVLNAEYIAQSQKLGSLIRESAKERDNDFREILRTNNYKLVFMLGSTIGGVLLFTDAYFDYRDKMVNNVK